MKRTELKENEPIKVPRGYVEYTRHFMDEAHTPVHEKELRYYTMVFTDGTIASESEPILSSKEEKEFLAREYDCHVHYVETSDLVLKDYSYAVTYTIARIWTMTGPIIGWRNYKVGMNIYMKDPKDKETYRTIRKLIEDINLSNASVNYSSLWSYTFGERRGLEFFEPTEIGEKVYNLKRI